jgi:two-component system response regulator AtoC
VGQQAVLVVEADAASRKSLADFLRDLGYQCVVVGSVQEALTPLARSDFLFTLLHLTSNGTNGFDLVHRLKLQVGDPGAIIGMVDEHDNHGPVDSIPLVIDTVLRQPFGREELEAAIKEATAPAGAPKSPPEHALARIAREMELWCSPSMRDVREIIREAARIDITVLVTGETGTGKDLVARAIHYFSGRRTSPFVKVNCAAVPRDLLESELFGHERGSFTGADKLKVGKFEAAHQGTIFLDEIGDLHPALQAKLLHVLQDGDFSRVGGKSTLKVDVRVVAATNQDLERAVAEGRFREDLYYRLNVIRVIVPPLRERIEEIPVLIEYFAQMYSKLFRREGFSIAPSVMERLLQHRYPGNVRELENLIKRMIVLKDPFSRPLSPSTEPTARSTHPPTTSVPEVSLKEISRKACLAAERDAIGRVLEQTGWNRVRAAKTLKISYRALLYKMKQVGLAGARSYPRPAATWGVQDRPGGWTA